MSEKPRSSLTLKILAPLMVVCCLGPILFASFAAGFFSWFAGIEPVSIALVVVLVTGIAFYFFRWRQNRRTEEKQMKEIFDD
ncbi:MAG: hypothetical protein JKX94_09585 [Sneathiella sp.]|nr:hypothetical protein [Sneathiella sp.]